MNPNEKKAPTAQPRPRRAWTPPAVTELPKLTELTLQTGGGIPGSGETGGSTVIA